MWRWLIRHWHASQRRTDIDFLWPSCRTVAEGNLSHARMAFRLHVSLDPAWKCLTDEERDQIIEGLR
jgi:hypothetical protein